MTTRVPTLCGACKRLTGNGVCTSFPEGIPHDIYAWGYDHRTSRDGEAPFELDPARQALYDEWRKYGHGATDADRREAA